ncbi:MAG: response regulator transcription factor, partial [Dehalococcoidia bacterium]|nr:response regulator transcription factor [Dehalococcoidia bacterium]
MVEAADGDAALAVARDAQPDVIVLDLVLPDVDGVEVCRQIRMFSDAYIVMLTSRADEVDKLIGLAVGADDYMTKPYSPRELSARVGALMRRPRTSGASASLAPAGPGAKRSFGDLELDPLAREVWVAGREVALTRIEFDLLDSLSRRPDMVHTRQMLLELVWGPNWIGDDHV